MYKYIAVTNGEIINCTDLLRIDENGVITQYDVDAKEWRSADSGMSGIYSGDIESEPITEAQAIEIIKRWSNNADKGV